MIRAIERKSNLLKPITLPKLKIAGNIFLAPMAGWSDASFRSICIDWGACFTYSEMVSAEALIRHSPKTLALLLRAENEEQLGIQIFVSNPVSAASCMAELRRFNPSVVDLNCGCSIPKIIKSGAGAALMQDPDKIREIVRALCRESDSPVTVKLRSGWDRDSINYIQTGLAAVEGGAAMITLHPRTRSQMFTGRADWEHIQIMKSRLDVPVIGSGDLFSGGDIRDLLEQTGCDGVMLGRGALGNPFIFKEIRELLREGGHGCDAPPSLRLETALKQLRLAIKIKGEYQACREMRKHFVAYSKGLPGSAVLRKKITQGNSLREYTDIITEYLGSYGKYWS